MKNLISFNEMVKNPKLVSFYMKKVFLEFKKIGLDIENTEIDKTCIIYHSYRIKNNLSIYKNKVEEVLNKYKNIFLKIDYILSYYIHNYNDNIHDNNLKLIGVSPIDKITITLYIKNSKTFRVKPNRYIYHYSPKKNRDQISKQGLLTKKFKDSEEWNSYPRYEYEDAIFAINDKEVKWDGRFDCWEIDTLNLKNKWWRDLNFNRLKTYIMTFEPIPPEFLKLL